LALWAFYFLLSEKSQKRDIIIIGKKVQKVAKKVKREEEFCHTSLAPTTSKAKQKIKIEAAPKNQPIKPPQISFNYSL